MFALSFLNRWNLGGIAFVSFSICYVLFVGWRELRADRRRRAIARREHEARVSNAIARFEKPISLNQIERW
jgi:hypothetical protein